MSKKYYSDNELIELCLLYFNLRVPFSEKEFVDASRREKAKWHPDKASEHRKKEFTSYFQMMSPISDVVLQKIKSNPTTFQKTSHAYVSQHIGQEKSTTGASSGGASTKSTRESQLEKDILTKNAEIETLNKNFLDVNTKLNHLLLHTKTLQEKMIVVENRLKTSEEKLKKQGSAAQVLDMVGLGEHADLASSQNIETIKGVVDTVKFLSNVLKK